MESEKTFVPWWTAARRLGVPGAWLKAEADAGRVPCLRVGRQRLFDVEALRAALADRMSQSVEVADAR